MINNDLKTAITVLARRDAGTGSTVGVSRMIESAGTESEYSTVLVTDNCVRAPLGHHIICECGDCGLPVYQPDPPTTAFRLDRARSVRSADNDDNDTRRTVIMMSILLYNAARPPQSDQCAPVSTADQSQADPQPNQTENGSTVAPVESSRPQRSTTDIRATTTNSTKYYSETGASQEFEWRFCAPSIELSGSLAEIHRSATDGRVETWTRRAERESALSAPALGILDRVWKFDQELLTAPTVCGVVRFTLFADGRFVKATLFARRDADADSVIGYASSSRTACFESAEFKHPTVLVSGNTVRAPLGHHIACESGGWLYSGRRPELRIYVGGAKFDRSIEEDYTDTRRSVGILCREPVLFAH